MPSKNNESDEKCDNQEIVDMLIEIGEYELNVNKQRFKYNAYRKAAESVRQYTKCITSVEEARKLVRLKLPRLRISIGAFKEGVGARIAEKIGEFLSKGEINKYIEVHNDEKAHIIEKLSSVSGIGPSTARKLYDDGVRSIEDLQAIKSNLTHHQQIGLKYYEEFMQRIPRTEMTSLSEFIRRSIHEFDNRYKVESVGSYRRGMASSRDLDILLTHPSYSTSDHLCPGLFQLAIEHLLSTNFLTDTMALGETKFMGVCRLSNQHIHRRIDIRLFPADEYFCAVFYFTGSANFNKRFRVKCLEKGFTLNEYCIRRIGSTGVPGEKLSVRSEKDLFNYVGERYLRPDERNV
ncbi:hypothetical protein ACOME3_007712 [Neoechinorhynchus agilis]